MFKTLILGLAALILGMLAYLYSEISQLRQEQEAATLTLQIEPTVPGEQGESVCVKISAPDKPGELILRKPGKYTIRRIREPRAADSETSRQ